MTEHEKYPKGHWMGIGICIGPGIGIPFGMIIGIFMGNIPIGIAIGAAMGVGIGLGIGAALEAKNKDKIRPLTEKEKRTRTIAAILGVVFLFAGILGFSYFLLNR